MAMTTMWISDDRSRDVSLDTCADWAHPAVEQT